MTGAVKIDSELSAGGMDGAQWDSSGSMECPACSEAGEGSRRFRFGLSMNRDIKSGEKLEQTEDALLAFFAAKNASRNYHRRGFGLARIPVTSKLSVAVVKSHSDMVRISSTVLAHAAVTDAISDAGLEPWPALFQTLRRSCEIEWAQSFPQHRQRPALREPRPRNMVMPKPPHWNQVRRRKKRRSQLRKCPATT